MRAPLALALLASGVALAQNYQPYPVAPRAAGMGGASVALGEGAGNSFYNPAALAFTSATAVELSGNVFVVDGATTHLVTGDQGQSTRLGFSIVPANLSLEVHGLKVGALELSDRWGLGVSVLAPFNYALNSLTVSQDTASLVHRSTIEQVYTIYNDLSYRFANGLGLGLAVVAVYRRFDTALESTVDLASGYQSHVDQRSEQSIGHTLALGGKWKSDFGLRAGLGMRLPLQNVFGTGEQHTRAFAFDPATGTIQKTSSDQELDVKYEQSFRFNFGLAWEVEHAWAVAVDLDVHPPYSFIALRDKKTGETLDTRFLQTTLNVAAGVEVWVKGHPVRAGFFTDRSPIADTPPGAAVAADSVPDRIDRYGGTLSLGFNRALYETEVGTVFAAGRLKPTGTNSAEAGARSVQGLQWQAMITWSSTLRY